MFIARKVSTQRCLGGAIDAQKHIKIEGEARNHEESPNTHTQKRPPMQRLDYAYLLLQNLVIDRLSIIIIRS